MASADRVKPYVADAFLSGSTGTKPEPIPMAATSNHIEREQFQST